MTLSTVAGGLRARLLRDSFRNMIEAGLSEIGWFDIDRQHRPVRLVAAPANWDEPIEPNLIAVSTTDTEDFELELGSDAARTVIPFFIDVYAEDEAVGESLSGDIRDIVRGRYPSIGRVRATFDIYDYRQATATPIGYCLINDVNRNRQATRVERAYLSNWFTVTCNVEDHYTGVDLAPVYLYPSPLTFPGPNTYPGGPPQP